jgi:SAM-dependent methyltransferase
MIKNLESTAASPQSVKTDDAPDFERYSADYEGRGWLWYRGLISDYIAFAVPGRVLDLGCGLGLLVECATRFGLDIAGIDGSPFAIAAGKRRNPDLDLSVHDLRTRLPFPDASFQGIICHQVIEHLTADSATFLLAECSRILRKGGTLLLYTPSCYNKEQALDPCHINLYAPSRLSRDLESAGFRIARLDANPMPVWPGGVLGGLLGRTLYKRLNVESLASTVNIIATKQDGTSDVAL